MCNIAVPLELENMKGKQLILFATRRMLYIKSETQSFLQTFYFTNSTGFSTSGVLLRRGKIK